MNYFILLKFILIFSLFIPLVRASPTAWRGFHDDVFVAFVVNGLDTKAAFAAHNKAFDYPEEFDDLYYSVGQHSKKIFKAYFGVLFLMRKNWHCDKINEKLINDQVREDCVKYSKYVNIIYEYFFQLYAKNANIAQPKFENYNGIDATIRNLSWISKYFFDQNNKKLLDWKNHYERLFGKDSYPKLKKEEELCEAFKKLRNEPSSDHDLKSIHNEFDKKLEELAKNAIEMANDKEMATEELIVSKIWHGHPFLKQEKLANNGTGIANDYKEMAEKEQIFMAIWQGHPFLKQEKLSKNGMGIANDNKNKEKMTEKKPKEENSKKRGKKSLTNSLITEG